MIHDVGRGLPRVSLLFVCMCACRTKGIAPCRRNSVRSVDDTARGWKPDSVTAEDMGVPLPMWIPDPPRGTSLESRAQYLFGDGGSTAEGNMGHA